MSLRTMIKGLVHQECIYAQLNNNTAWGGCCPARCGISVEPTVVLCSQLLELHRSRNQRSRFGSSSHHSQRSTLGIFISSPCKSRYCVIGGCDPTGVELFTRGTIIVPLNLKRLSDPSSEIHASL